MNHAADPARREAILEAMQDRLDWLRENPDVPIWHWGNETLFSASRPEVTAVAALVGEEPEELAHACRVTKHFGAGVTYVARAEGARDMAAAGVTK